MRNISSELTVFFITSGYNPNEESCLSALKNQTCLFTLQIIRNYSPMSVAFQEMLIRCKTPYYIEVDGDMLLQKNTIEKMYNEILPTDSKTAMQCYRLRDVHLDFPIYGIKIYKHDIFKNYPYDIKHPSCEVKQLDDIKKDGYTYTLIEDIVGEHSTFWTDTGIYERYYNLMQKFRLFKYVWMRDLPKKLVGIYQKSPTEQNLYALCGAIIGLSDNKIIDGEKDSRIKPVGIGRIKSFFDNPTSATVYVTNKCNFFCTWCKRQSESSMESFSDTDPKLVNTLLLKFPTISGLCLCGYGEPLMGNTLFPIINIIKKHQKYIGIISNGSLLKQKLPELIANPPNYISVSLNAHNKEEHEKCTKTKTWDTVLEGIKACVNSPIEIYVSSVVTTENIKNLPELIKLIHSLGVKTLHLHNLLPGDDTKLDDVNFWNLVLQKEHQYILDELATIPESSIVKKWPQVIDRTGGFGTCEFPWKSIAVDGNGSISICNSCLPCKKENGNINDWVVWNNDYCSNFRDEYIKQSKNIPCSMCFRNWRNS